MTVQKVVQLTFAEEGIAVSIAGDGDSAMLDYAEFKPDIVLADVHMPGLSGYQVCERIKQDNGNIPVVLLVGSFEPFDEEEAKRVGADGSITKPFQSIRQLIDTVSSLLSSDRPPMWGEPGLAPDTAAGQSNFAETLEIPSYQEIPSYPDGAVLGDSGMDDEMIETTRMDDTGAPETDDGPEPYDEPAPATADARSFENGVETPEYNLERVIDEPDEPEVTGEMDEPKEPYVSDEPFVSDGSDVSHVYDDPDELPMTQALDDPAEEEYGEPSLEVSQPQPAAPVMELDDMNFLEIPVAGVPVLPPVYEEAPGPVEDTSPSPEFVETVVQRVVEKLSGESLREVIRDVVREIRSERSGD
jgi:CheY-like chemotaxis protein